MVPYQKRSTTRLPLSLLEEIQAQNNERSTRNSKHPQKHSFGRKEARKKGRAEQKQKKALFFSAGKKRHGDDVPPSPPRKKARTDDPIIPGSIMQDQVISEKTATSQKVVQNQHFGLEEVKNRALQGHQERGREKLKLKDKGKGKELSVEPPRTRVEEEEDAYIAYLEKRLGYGKQKQKKNLLEEDGLDDLLDWTDSLVPPKEARAIKYEQNEADEEESELEFSPDSESVAEEQDKGEGEDVDPEGEEWGGIILSTEAQSSTHESEIEEQERDGVEHSPSTGPTSTVSDTSLIGVRMIELLDENLFSEATRYIPPHLRRKEDEQESEDITKLKKQLKGLLNRMSEQNLTSIIDSSEELYRNNRRHDVTASITSLVIEGISSHSILLDSYVVLHAALISSLSKIVGVEFAAYFVQNVVSEYERHRRALLSPQSEIPANSQPQDQEKDPKGKESSNLMVLLSELYNFQVISSVLVFDLVRQLLQDNLSEFDVELLLKLMRNSGQQLRQDDPSALKDIIDIVQKKVAGKDEKLLSSRTRFMIETLVNLKNNKLKRNVSQNQGGEAVERMKKFLSNLSKRKHVLAHDALRVTLDDLHSAESKGKWWLVGAAWGGDPLLEAQESMANTQVNGRAATADDATSNLLNLARKQGMNTDIRRSIFVVLMSSDDFVDACERLSQLNLTDIQQREIVRVLLHCCGNEKTYNPYYSLVCQQLCRQLHSFKITLQFCLWDFLRDLGEATVGGTEVVKNARNNGAGFELKKISGSRVRNVARAYAWWISKDVVNLSILKAVDFTMLKPLGQNFLQELLQQIFISSQSTTPLVDASQLSTTQNRSAIEEIFIKATRTESLAMGLVYFLTNCFSEQSYHDDKVGSFVKWANGLALETLRTGVDIIPTL